ncbi:MAG: ATP-binding protein [Gaiellaceae bacterium]
MVDEDLVGRASRNVVATSPPELQALEGIIGREGELGTIGRFLEDLTRAPASLVIEGEPGIGKTTLWAAGVERARRLGYRILVAQPAEAETQLSFAAVADLLSPVVAEVLPVLPPPQRSALEVALLLVESEGAGPDQRAVAAALLGALRRLSDSGPVVLAIDDFQWLDANSAAVLEFAVRRLRDEPVGVLLSCRPGGGAPSRVAERPGGRSTRSVEVAPLPLSAIHEVLFAQLGVTFARPILVRIHGTSGGNPFFALELARALERHGGPVEPGEPLPVPADLGALVTDRIATLPVGTREALLVASALSPPTLALLSAAIEGDAEAILAPAFEGEVAKRDEEKIVFAHPLLAFAAYSQASAQRRRELHRRLAALVTDPEERARHLAIAAEGPDEEIALALDEGAQSAFRRGAIHTAAELCEQARRLTPPERSEDVRRRGTTEAEYRILATDSAGARDVLEEIAVGVSGAERADLLRRLGDAYLYGVDWRSSAETYRQALAENGIDDALRAKCEIGLATASELIDTPVGETRGHAQAAVELAQSLGDRSLLGEGLAIQALSELLLGCGRPWSLIEQARALEPWIESIPVAVRPSQYRAHMLGLVDDFQSALAGYEEGRREALESGDELSQAWILGRMSQLACLDGAWTDATAHVNEGEELLVQAGQPVNMAFLLASRALIEAHLGHVDSARQAGEAALKLSERTNAALVRRTTAWALGRLALSLGQAAEAHAHLGPIVAETRAAGIREPGEMRFFPDEIEALLVLEHVDEAESMLAFVQECAARTGRVSALAAAARCRGTLAAARGDLEQAEEALQESTLGYSNVSLPFERARTLLALGSTRLRAKRKRAARESLEEARAAFERLGAAVWVERVRAELGRIGGRRPSDGSLTGTERRVAELVAQGHTNREVAAALFVSQRTVEGHLSRIYAKLGVRSRTGLARRIAEHGTTAPNR